MTVWTRRRSVVAVLLAVGSAQCSDDSTGPQFAARMYVGDTNAGGGAVLIYTAPYSAGGGPTDSVTHGSKNFYGVTVDANGNLAATVEGGPSQVFFFDAPVRSGAVPRDSIAYLGFGVLLAYGPGGRLFVGTSSTNLLIYNPPFTSASVPDTIKAGLFNSYSIAFDTTDRLYVGDISGGQAVVYDSPYTAPPAFTIVYDSALVTGVAVDRGGRLFVADYAYNQIFVYEPPVSGASVPAFTITIGIENPVGMTFGAEGSLYVVNQGGGTPYVTIYEPPFSAVSAPSVTMNGGGRFVAPYGIAVGPR